MTYEDAVRRANGTYFENLLDLDDDDEEDE